MRQRIHNKLRSQSGLSILVVLLLFLLCSAIGSAILAAATATAGRASRLAESDRRYYSVISAAKFFADQVRGQTVTLGQVRVRTETTRSDGSSLPPETKYPAGENGVSWPDPKDPDVKMPEIAWITDSDGDAMAAAAVAAMGVSLVDPGNTSQTNPAAVDTLLKQIVMETYGNYMTVQPDPANPDLRNAEYAWNGKFPDNAGSFPADNPSGTKRSCRFLVSGVAELDASGNVKRDSEGYPVYAADPVYGMIHFTGGKTGTLEALFCDQDWTTAVDEQNQPTIPTDAFFVRVICTPTENRISLPDVDRTGRDEAVGFVETYTDRKLRVITWDTEIREGR